MTGVLAGNGIHALEGLDSPQGYVIQVPDGGGYDEKLAHFTP